MIARNTGTVSNISFGPLSRGYTLLLLAIFLLTNCTEKAENLFEQYYQPPSLSPGASAQADQENYLYVGRLIQDQIMDRPDSLIVFLEDRLKNGLPPTEISQWYLALTYLRADQPNQSHRILKNIVYRGGHPYTDQARELIQKLENTQNNYN